MDYLNIQSLKQILKRKTQTLDINITIPVMLNLAMGIDSIYFRESLRKVVVPFNTMWQKHNGK